MHTCYLCVHDVDFVSKCLLGFATLWPSFSITTPGVIMGGGGGGRGGGGGGPVPPTFGLHFLGISLYTWRIYVFIIIITQLFMKMRDRYRDYIPVYIQVVHRMGIMWLLQQCFHKRSSRSRQCSTTVAVNRKE